MICDFVFAWANIRFSCDAAQIICNSLPVLSSESMMSGMETTNVAYGTSAYFSWHIIASSSVHLLVGHNNYFICPFSHQIVDNRRLRKSRELKLVFLVLSLNDFYMKTPFRLLLVSNAKTFPCNIQRLFFRCKK